MQKQKLWFGLTALAAAWLFDFLFWQKQGGISFLIWTAVLLGVGYLLAWHEGKKPSFWSILLTILILGFAALSAWRSEAFTRFSTMVVAMSGLLLLVATFTNGNWVFYRMVDFATELGKTLWSGMSRAFSLFIHTEGGAVPPDLTTKKSGLRRGGSVLLGLLIALPIVIVLGLMLAAADPVFGDMLKRLLNIEHLPEYIFRLIYILVGAYVMIGLYLHAILPARQTEQTDPDQAWMKPFLGWTEGGIVLGAVNLLFITFVVIQVRYLFGGSANINETGYTYADYARRGFGELVGVAVLSLLLYLTLNTITKRESKPARVGFSALSVLLMANVLVILASSLQRLLLYESAYGFSELRTYTHVFIFWLAGLILAAIVLELINKRGRFALGLLVMVVGFTATLGLMNVDGVVASQNIQRAAHGADLDVNYLNTLTTDAIPVMVQEYQKPAQPQAVHDALGAELACRTIILEHRAIVPWQGYRFGQALADRLIRENQSSWNQFKPVSDGSGSWNVAAAGKEYSCSSYQGMD